MQSSEGLRPLAAGANANDALLAVTDNYGRCRATADRLNGLQQWVKWEYGVTPQ